MFRVVFRLVAVSGAVAIFSLSSAYTVFAVSDDSEPETGYAEQPAILISEIQTRTVESQYDEFIELYNTTEEEIDLSTWELQYRRNADDEWESKILSEQPDDVSYLIEPGESGEFYVIGSNKFIEKNDGVNVSLVLKSGSPETDGHIRLVEVIDNDNSEKLIIHDLVGWGEADDPLGEAAPAPERGESITRCFDENGFMVNTDNNSDDFTVNVTPLPGQGIDCPEPAEDDAPPPNEDDEEQTGDDSGQYNEACEDILITEVLPNPEGPRSEHPREEHAFIELYNAHDTDYIPLEGCGLEAEYVSSENKAGVFWFKNTELAPGEYRAFYEEETNIALPVSPSGRVYLLSDDEVELDYVVYPDAVSEGAAWARFGADEWQETYALSPGDDNVLQSLRPCPDGEERNPETNRCRSMDTDDSQELEPCGEGRERNPETNRCRNTESDSSSLKPCGPGRERNPETNRCRNIESSLSTLVPCGPGRRRNPETNRCRNISSPGSDLKPCGQGRERNPETNRCRKIASATSNLKPCGEGRKRNPETNRCRNVTKDNEGAIAGVKDIETVAVSSRPSWWLVSVMVLLAIGYAGWEWRYDINNLVSRVRNRSPP